MLLLAVKSLLFPSGVSGQGEVAQVLVWGPSFLDKMQIGKRLMKVNHQTGKILTIAKHQIGKR